VVRNEKKMIKRNKKINVETNGDRTILNKSISHTEKQIMNVINRDQSMALSMLGMKRIFNFKGWKLMKRHLINSKIIEKIRI
jgi:hypothetical protein